MMPVRCRGCRRQVGVAAAMHNGVYCDEVCATDIPVSTNEDRDDLIELLIRTGTDRATVGKEFGLTRQRLSQMLSKRTAVAA